MNKLARNILDYLIGGATSKIIHIGVFLWLADRIGPTNFGQFSVFVSSVVLITVLLTLNLHGGISRYFYEEDNEGKSFLNTIALTIGLFFTLWLAAVFTFEAVFYDILSTGYIISGALAIFSEIISSAYIQVAQSQKQSSKVAIFQIFRFSSMGIAIYFALQFFWSGDQPLGIILFYSIGMFVPSFVIFTLYLARNFYIKPRLDHLIYSTKYSVPMAIYVLCSLLLLHSDRIMISEIIGYQEAGIYSYASTLAMVILLLVNAVLGAWTPFYFERMNAQDYPVVKLQSERILVFCGVAALMISSVLSVTFQFVLPANYMTAIPLFSLMVLVYYLAVAWQLYGRHLGYFKLTPYVALIGFSTCLLNIILNWFMINEYGSMGAVAATVLSYLFMVIFGYYLTMKILNLVVLEISFLMKILQFFAVFIAIELMFGPNLDSAALAIKVLMNFALIAFYYWVLVDHAWVRNYVSTMIIKKAN